MEQQEPRRQFIENFYEFIEPIQLNQAFIDGLKAHPNSEYLQTKLPNDMAKKAFIFTEFTRERSTCEEMVRILHNSGQKEAAENLRKFNTSPPFIGESNEIELKVTPATVMRSAGSKLFPMDGNPRGKCIIINNVKKELGKESLRFESIFKQLYFEVELCYDMSAEQIDNRLRELAKEPRLRVDNALVVMIISHGHDEKVICFDEKELLIKDIVDIFSETNCKALNRKPKLFFFNCCRIKKTEVPVRAVQLPDRNKIIIELDTVGQNWINDNKYTLICFACAEGYKSWFIRNQFTYFGQALSHCIAQYSCDKSLLSIINFTCERMSKHNKREANQCSPELRLCKMTRDLFLNPGLPKNEV